MGRKRTCRVNMKEVFKYLMGTAQKKKKTLIHLKRTKPGLVGRNYRFGSANQEELSDTYSEPGKAVTSSPFHKQAKARWPRSRDTLSRIPARRESRPRRPWRFLSITTILGFYRKLGGKVQTTFQCCLPYKAMTANQTPTELYASKQRNRITT